MRALAIAAVAAATTTVAAATPRNDTREPTTKVSVTAAVRSSSRAHGSRTLGVRDEGHLGFVFSEATAIVDEGMLRGTIPGRGRVHFAYNGSPTVSASFTIRAPGETLSGRARCHLNNPTSPTPSFRGALTIAGGSGRYAHARGSGELFGVFHRHGYSLVVQAIGRLRY